MYDFIVATVIAATCFGHVKWPYSVVVTICKAEDI